MDKKIVIEYFGSVTQAAAKLGYKSRQCVYNWPNELSKGRMEAIIRRMKAERIDVPKEWGV